MSIFSTRTIKSSKGRSLYKYYNSPVRIAQESTYMYKEIDTANIDFFNTIDNIMNQMESLKSNQENILKIAKAKVNKNVNLIDVAKSVIPYIENMPEDVSIDIPNARVYHNIESGNIGFHSIFVELRNEINSLNELLLVLKNLSIGYKVPESELIIKDMLNQKKDYRNFSVDFINYFSSPVDKIDKTMVINYVNDFLYMMNNYYNLVKNSFDLVCNSLNNIYNSLSNIKRSNYNFNNTIFDNENVKELINDKMLYISNMYSNIVKYLHTYQISLEQRFDADITAIKMLYDSMTEKINADNVEDSSIEDDVEYGRFLAETSIINEAENSKVDTYVIKITGGIRTAWNKLNEKVNEAIKKITEKYNGKLDELDAQFDKIDPKFTITNYPNYDFTKLSNIKLLPIDYNNMKESLRSENDFIKKYYPNIQHEEKSNFKDDIINYVTTSKQDLNVDSQVLHDMINFIRTGYQENRKSVQADIETMNKSNQEIVNLAKNISAKPEGNDANSIKVDTNVQPTGGESTILSEADNDATKIVDNPDRTSANTTSGGDSNSFLKDISVYMKVSSSIICAKMRILLKHLLLSVNTVIHASTPPKQNKEKPVKK